MRKMLLLFAFSLPLWPQSGPCQPGQFLLRTRSAGQAVCVNAGPLITILPEYWQADTVPILNNNFGWLNDHKAGLSQCPAHTVGIETTTAGLMCLALDASYFDAAAKQGGGTKLLTFSGGGGTGDCLELGPDGAAVSSGDPCGTGGSLQGDPVGTTEVQTLTNKTLDPSNSVDAGAIKAGTILFGRLPIGQSADTVPVGNDSRFSDARAPLAHASSHLQTGGDPLSGLRASQINSSDRDGSGTKILMLGGSLPTDGQSPVWDAALSYWRPGSGTGGDAITSVFGRVGVVIAQAGDYNTSQVTESGNLYITAARVRAALSASGIISYDSGSGTFSCPNCIGTTSSPATGDVGGSFSGGLNIGAVGGQSAANVAIAVSAVNAATSSNTPSTVMKRDSAGNVSVNVIGNVTGNVAGNAATTSAFAAEPSKCSGGQVSNGIHADGSPNCITPAGGGNVSNSGASVNGNVPTFVGTSGGLITDSGKAAPAGAFVGTTDAQAVTNKSMDATNSIDGGAVKSGTVAGARLGTHTHVEGDVTNLTSDLAAKEPTITAGTASQVWIGSKSWFNISALTFAWSQITSGIPSTFAPSGHGANHKDGGPDEVATTTAAAGAIPKAGAGGKLGAGWIPDLSSTYQPADSDLTAIAGLSTTGLEVRTASGSQATRSIAGTSGRITVTNGDGVSGNPTIDVGANIVDKNAASTFAAGATQTFAPSATAPAIVLLCGSLPSSPATGALACDSGASNAVKQWNGSAWQTLSGGGGSGVVAMSSGGGPPTGNCTAPSASYLLEYADTSHGELWYCAATNTWKKFLSTTDTGPYFVSGQTGAPPAAPEPGNVNCGFSVTSNTQVCVDSSGNAFTMVKPEVGSTNNFLTGITANGIVTKAQPSFANISGTASTGQIPDLSGTYLTAAQKGAASGVASLGSNIKVPLNQLPVGNDANSVAAGNDSRFSDARAPVPHTLLGNYHSDTNSSASPTRGALMARGATNWDSLALGSQYGVLQAGAADPFWGLVDLTHSVTGQLPSANIASLSSLYMTAVSGNGAITVVGGVPQKVAGNGTDCVLVNGSSGACGTSGSAGVGRATLAGTWTAINDMACQDQTATWTGITTADTVTLGIPSGLPSGLLASARVSATDTVNIRICNISGTAVTPGAQTFKGTLAVYNLSNSASLNFGALIDHSCGALTFGLTGAASGDPVTPGWPASLEAGLIGNMRVSTADTIEVRLCNLSGASIDPAGQTFKAVIAK